MKSKIWKIIKEYASSIGLAILVVLILQSFVLVSFKVDGRSMYPTLNNNDRGFAFVFRSKLNMIDRFDIVVINSLKHDNNKWVKRIIAFEGETVEFKDSKLYINDQLVAQDFLAPGQKTNDFPKHVVAKGHVFVVGDNRMNSADSRIYGDVAREDVIAAGLFVFYPFDNFGWKK